MRAGTSSVCLSVCLCRHRHSRRFLSACASASCATAGATSQMPPLLAPRDDAPIKCSEQFLYSVPNNTVLCALRTEPLTVSDALLLWNRLGRQAHDQNLFVASAAKIIINNNKNDVRFSSSFRISARLISPPHH